MQDRINIARFNTDTIPNVPPFLMENDALGDNLQQQCNIQDSGAGCYNRYTDGQNNVNDSKVKV